MNHYPLLSLSDLLYGGTDASRKETIRIPCGLTIEESNEFDRLHAVALADEPDDDAEIELREYEVPVRIMVAARNAKDAQAVVNENLLLEGAVHYLTARGAIFGQYEAGKAEFVGTDTGVSADDLQDWPRPWQ